MQFIINRSKRNEFFTGLRSVNFLLIENWQLRLVFYNQTKWVSSTVAHTALKHQRAVYKVLLEKGVDFAGHCTRKYEIFWRNSIFSQPFTMNLAFLVRSSVTLNLSESEKHNFSFKGFPKIRCTLKNNLHNISMMNLYQQWLKPIQFKMKLAFCLIRDIWNSPLMVRIFQALFLF